MATWLVPARARPLPYLWLQVRSHLSVALQAPSPASLEVESMRYPSTRPDAAVFEPISDEYAAASTHDPHHFTPLSSSETLVSLVAGGNFSAADALRKEMSDHQMSISRDPVYLRAARHAITQRRPAKKGLGKERLDAFEAWLSLVPERHETWLSFHDVRQWLFRNMDHVNLQLVYRFGLVLAAKGYYSGEIATLVVSTLARYARPSVVGEYLRQVEDAAREYGSKTGAAAPSDWSSNAYNLSVRTVALEGKGDGALCLISQAQSRGVPISDFTLDIVAKHAWDRQTTMDCIRSMHPLWTPQDTGTRPAVAEHEDIPVEQTAEVAVLAARLRAIRNALRSPQPPSTHALRSFITSYLALGRTRALPLLRTLAFHHSPKFASAWVFTMMLHHHARREHLHLLSVFQQHFHLVGVPRKTLLALVRGPQGQRARKSHERVFDRPPDRDKLWPSAYHTALVWDAVVTLSPGDEPRARLYALLRSLVERTRQPEPEPTRIQVQLGPTTFDAAHFSPFVSAWARRRPVEAARVLGDMIQLGVAPTVVQWSMVARGYAQHGDPRVALGILDRLTGRESGNESFGLLGIHTNVLRGFILAGDARHAREVARRLVERLGYRAGTRPATDAGMALLRGLEERLGLDDPSR